jgi:hypothetical protein
MSRSWRAGKAAGMTGYSALLMQCNEQKHLLLGPVLIRPQGFILLDRKDAILK